MIVVVKGLLKEVEFNYKYVHSMDIDSRGRCMVYFKIMQSHWIIQV